MLYIVCMYVYIYIYIQVLITLQSTIVKTSKITLGRYVILTLFSPSVIHLFTIYVKILLGVEY